MEAERRAKEREAEQRVIDEAPILTVPHITNAPPIMLTCNLTAKQVLKTTKRLHRRITCNNTPAIVPLPLVINPVPLMNSPTARALQWIPRLPEGLFNRSIPFVAQPAPCAHQPDCQQMSTRTAIPSTARQHNITQHAINILTLKEQVSFNGIYISTKLMKHKFPVHFEHYNNPMVHPVTEETILIYKKLMNDPTTAEVWQTAVGKDFGGMAQGDNKTGQKDPSAMFIMTWEDIVHALAAGKFSRTAIPSWTFAPKRSIRTKSASRSAAI